MPDSDYQCKMILFWLKERGSITAKEAEKLCGCKDLRSRIRRLKKTGYPNQHHDKREKDPHSKPFQVCDI